MLLLDLTLPTPEENLALDEALLEAAEAGELPHECLRLWEPRAPLVVVGRSSHVAHEVHAATCRERGIPVLRRTSGGASIVTGPGCLMYALILSLHLRPALRSIDTAHRFVLHTLARAIGVTVSGVRCQGISDLVLGERKFSGNSLRVKREHLLYHGTLLYDFPMALVVDCLAQPPRQPAYRGGRSHGEFVTNLPVSADELRYVLADAWSANRPPAAWPEARTGKLARTKYSDPGWNERY
jgi:lipoate-protein ligase A